MYLFPEVLSSVFIFFFNDGAVGYVFFSLNSGN